MKPQSELTIINPCITSFVTVLNNYRKQLVSYLAATLLLFGQFVTVVHAADHAYHAHDDSCAVYKAAEKHELTHAPVGLHFEVVLTDEDLLGIAASNLTSIVTSGYLARAPPYHS
jgi:hypothetical protein